MVKKKAQTSQETRPAGCHDARTIRPYTEKIRNHVMITLIHFGSGRRHRVMVLGSRQTGHSNYHLGQHKVKVFQSSIVDGEALPVGLVPRTEQICSFYFIFPFKLVQGGAKKLLPGQRWTAVARRSGYGSRD